MDMPDTPAAELRPTLDRLRTAWQRNRPDARLRMDDLARLRDAFKAGREAMLTAISADFGHRSAHETQIGRASCRERVCQLRVDLGGRRIIKKTKNRPQQIHTLSTVQGRSSYKHTIDHIHTIL